jgi:hypothetical protein
MRDANYLDAPMNITRSKSPKRKNQPPSYDDGWFPSQTDKIIRLSRLYHHQRVLVMIAALAAAVTCRGQTTVSTEAARLMVPPTSMQSWG